MNVNETVIIKGRYWGYLWVFVASTVLLAVMLYVTPYKPCGKGCMDTFKGLVCYGGPVIFLLGSIVWSRWKTRIKFSRQGFYFYGENFHWHEIVSSTIGEKMIIEVEVWDEYQQGYRHYTRKEDITGLNISKDDLQNFFNTYRAYAVNNKENKQP